MNYKQKDKIMSLYLSYHIIKYMEGMLIEQIFQIMEYIHIVISIWRKKKLDENFTSLHMLYHPRSYCRRWQSRKNHMCSNLSVIICVFSFPSKSCSSSLWQLENERSCYEEFEYGNILFSASARKIELSIERVYSFCCSDIFIDNQFLTGIFEKPCKIET